MMIFTHSKVFFSLGLQLNLIRETIKTKSLMLRSPLDVLIYQGLKDLKCQKSFRGGSYTKTSIFKENI